MRTFIENSVDETGQDRENSWELMDILELKDNDIESVEYGKEFLGRRNKIETNEDVSDRLHDLGIENVDLSGAKEIWQKKVAKSLEDMTEKYPEVKGFIDSVRMAKLPEDAIACAVPKQVEQGIRSEILLNEKHFSKYNLEFRIVNLEAENYRKEKYMAGYGLDGIMKHEMGHILHLRMIAKSAGIDINNASPGQLEVIKEKYSRNSDVTNICNSARRGLGISEGDVGKHLSVYGARNYGEFFAEAISEYETSKKPRALAIRVHEKYVEYMNSISQWETIREKSGAYADRATMTDSLSV